MRYRARHLTTLVVILLSGNSLAQNLHFYATPYQADEGGAVVFHYLPDPSGSSVSAVPLDEIASWKWDFDGDEIWDVEKTVSAATRVNEINASWFAVFDEVLDADSDGVISYTPRLQIEDINGDIYKNVTPGVTEDVFGTDGSIDRDVSVVKRSVGNKSITVNFSASPRLASNRTEIRFFSDTEFAEGVSGTITSYSWDFDGDGTPDSSAANPTFTYPDVTQPTPFDVSLMVTYEVEEVSDMLTETKRDYIRVVAVGESLELGRAYRRGFPDTYGWEDILEAYAARGVGNNRYVYFNHFEEAFFTTQTDLVGMPNVSATRQTMGEVVNELLQGQTLVGNQRLIEALRIKYPRITSYDPDNPPDELPSPAGARTETAAIDTALLDYQLPIQYAANAIRQYGTDILRSRAPEGTEPFPQFPRYLSFEDPSLSQAPIPVKNEYWQLSTAFERMGLGRVEKAKKLFRLSVREPEAREEAKQACKKTGMQSYLGLALLAAGQSEEDFQLNEGNRMRAHLKNARDLFESINAGENPLGNDGSFIPNESFTATLQDAQDAVADARETEINARQEERTWERYQADLRNEHLAQRSSYLTPLTNLTSIDPDGLYNGLQTINDQRDYRLVIESRLNALEEDYPNANPAILGELGETFLAVKDAELAVEQAKNELSNVFKRIDVAKWENAEIENINSATNEKLAAADLLFGLAQALFNDRKGTTNSIGNFLGAAVFTRGKTLERTISTIQQAKIDNIRLEAEIRGRLLEVANLGLGIQRAQNNLRSNRLRLDNNLSRMERLIEDLAHTRNTAADLYFQDPSFRVVVSDAMRRAEAELDFAIDRLYRMARTLEYQWTESYQNPIVVPVNSQEPASLENPLFDKFTDRDSLFFVRSADEAKDYLDALRAWDSKLRRVNVVSVRGPNFSGPISAEPISMREQILGFRPDPERGYTLENSIRDFRNFLEGQRTGNFFNLDNPSLKLNFATTIEDNRFFPATGSRWNMRINTIAADIYAESGFSNKQVAEIDLVQSGVVALRRFFADPPEADDVLRLTQNVDNVNRTAFAIALSARINGATGNRPLNEFDNEGLRGRPVAASNWILRIDTEGPTNAQIDFSRIKDIVIRFTYTFGNPEEFSGF